MTLPSPTGRDPLKGLEFLAKVVTPLVAIAVLVLAIANLVESSTASTNSEAVLDGNAISACRVEYSSQVTEAQDLVDGARDAQADLVMMGLVAAATGDDELLANLVAEVPVVADRIDEARARKVEAVERYADAVERSTVDPEAFLDACRETP